MSDSEKDCEVNIQRLDAERPFFDAEACLDLTPAQIEFLRPEPPEEVTPTPPDEEPIVIRNRAVTFACPSGQVNEGLTTTSSTPANAEAVEVFLGDIRELPLRELVRLRSKQSQLQQIVDDQLHGAVDDNSAFISAVVAATMTSTVAAGIIYEFFRQSLLSLESIILTELETNANCSYRNSDLWLVCADNEDGYVAYLAEPPGYEAIPESNKTFIPANVYQSSISAEDVNLRAVEGEKRALGCLFGNAEVTVECDEQTVVWNGASTPLSSLHGTSFVTLESAVSGARPTLVFYSTIAAGEYFASSQAAADALAENAAIAGLQCLAPSAQQYVSCASVNSSAADRMAATGMTEDEILNEMVTGNKTISRAALLPDTVLVTDVAGETVLNDNLTTRVLVTQGAFVSTTQTAASILAEQAAMSVLACSWTSPEYFCECVANGETTPDVSGVRSSRYKHNNAHFYLDEAGLPIGVKTSEVSLRPAGNNENTLPRGTFVSDTFPGASLTSAEVWPSLPLVCQSALDCVFDACAVSLCEAKPDDRPLMANGEPNRMFSATDGVVDENTHEEAWIKWKEQFVAPSFTCGGSPAAFLCDGGATAMDDPAFLTQLSAGWYAEELPFEFGTPARFLYGGILTYGYTWRSQACDGILTQTSDGVGNFSGAEGRCEAINPVDLAAVLECARQDATSRQDCTHATQLRVLKKCAESGTRQTMNNAYTNLEVESSTTRDSNESIEGIILQLMKCEDSHSFKITSHHGTAGAVTSINNCSAQGVNECFNNYVTDITFWADCDGTPVNTQNFLVTESLHFFATTFCCDGVIQFNLVKAPCTDTYDDVLNSSTGMSAEVRAILNTLMAADENSNVLYIGTIAVKLVGGVYLPIVKQYVSSPFLITECCDGSSSSSSSGSSSSGSSSSKPSSSSSSSGSSSSGSSSSKPSSVGSSRSSGSSKDTAIVPGPDGGYIKWFTMEAAEVLFFDFAEFEVTAGENVLPIDPAMLFCVEKNSIWPFLSPDKEFASAHVTEDRLIVQSRVDQKVKAMLKGIRKDFAGVRLSFSNFEEFVDNECRLNPQWSREVILQKLAEQGVTQ